MAAPATVAPPLAQPEEPAAPGPVARPRRGPWRPLALASCACYLLLTAFVTWRALLLDDGHLVYTLDDPYIHLAMARTWIASGNLGIWPGAFAPATSSPLWTALVTALSYPLGVRVWLPYALDVLSCLLLLCLFWWGTVGVGVGLLPRAGRRPAWWWYVPALLLPVIGHLPGLTLSGLEHPLHAALTIAFAVALFRVLQGGEPPLGTGLYLLALLLPLTRLEGAFAVAVGALLLLLRRRVGPAVTIALLGALPTALLGLAFRARGAYFLSNSIVAKAVPVADLHGWLTYVHDRFLWNLKVDQTLEPVLLVALIWAFEAWRSRRRPAMEEASFFLAVAALHLALADTGWFDRYEAYLIDLGLFFFARHTWPRALPGPIATLRREGALGAGLACFLIFGFGANKVDDLRATPLATNNIYEQQYQMARFIAAYYPRGAVVANDVGLISLEAGGPVTDLAGLGSTDILRLLRADGGRPGLRPDQVEPILRRNGADVIVIYPQWFSPALTAGWYPVATWTIGKQQVTPAFTSVTFYAHSAAQFPALRRNLAAFAPQLPTDVQVAYHPAPG